MEMKPYIVYVKTDSSGCITAVNSSAFLGDMTGWVEIDSGYGDKHHHAQGNYFGKPIMTMGGAYRYKLVDGKAVECTAAEIKAQEEARKPVPVARRNMTAGEYATIDGVLYLATGNIPNGEPIVVGQNAVKTSVEEQLYTMKGE